nr:hypothetical protein [uncultured Pedobacter sp.]
MKNLELNRQNILRPILLVTMVFAVLLSACDLRLQQKVPFNPESPELPTFKDQTAWDWIQSHPGGDFTYMEQAINVTGLQNLYSQLDTPRTYLLLKNVAFTQTNGILQLITGSTKGSLATLNATNTQRLKNLLMYHIISKYVDQGPDNLKVLYKDYFFQTLLPGPQGIVSINRNENFKMIFNASPTLPATKRRTVDATQTLHNYIFKNGIADLLPIYIGLTPF